MRPQPIVHIAFNCDHEASFGGEGDDSNRRGAEAIGSSLDSAGFRVALLPVASRELAPLRALAGDERALVFNLVESLDRDTREHPRVPERLDALAVPYIGACAATLRTCLFKDRAKQVLVRAGVRTPAACVLRDAHELADSELPLPAFVKLLHEDASIGVTERNVARSVPELRARAAELIAQYHQPVLVERYIEGREVNVSVLGTGSSASTLPLHEIDFAAMPAGRPHIVSFAAKWDEQHPDYRGTQPVPLRDASAALRAAIKNTALAAYRALGARDYGRVDLRVDSQGVPWVIDVNPNCDISDDAGFARAARAYGLSHPALLQTICELAIARYRDVEAPATEAQRALPRRAR